MSKETIAWLNQNVLMGFCADREAWATQGLATADHNPDSDNTWKPWFARDGYQHAYPNAIPMDALENLFAFEVASGPAQTTITRRELCDVDVMDGIDDAGNCYRNVPTLITDPTRQAIVRTDTGQFFGFRKNGYEIHQYHDWLVNNVATILDSDLEAASAGVYRGGGAAWVAAELPDTVVVNDFPIRPKIVALTSHDATVMTTYKMGATAPLCDNEMALFGRRGQHTFKLKHTSGSTGRVQMARDALGIMFKQTEEMKRFVDKMTRWKLSNSEFLGVLDTLHPKPEEKRNDKGAVTNQHAINTAAERRGRIIELYTDDPRCAPWKGTAMGTIQALSTYNLWDRPVNGKTDDDRELARFDRNFGAAIGDGVAEFHDDVMAALRDVAGQQPWATAGVG